MLTALLLISFQGEYFHKKAKKNIKGAGKSAKSAARLLHYFRENNLPVVHILHTGKAEGLSVERLNPHELLEPKHEELSVLTSEFNAFADKKLDQILRKLDVTHLLIAGLTAENQVLYTANTAKELGYSCKVVKDACAACSLKFEGEKIKAEQVHQLVMAMMSNQGVGLTTAKEYIKTQNKEAKKLKKATERQEAIERAAKEALEAASKEESYPTPPKKDKRQPKSSVAKKEGSNKATSKTKTTIKAKKVAPNEIEDLKD